MPEEVTPPKEKKITQEEEKKMTFKAILLHVVDDDLKPFVEQYGGKGSEINTILLMQIAREIKNLHYRK